MGGLQRNLEQMCCICPPFVTHKGPSCCNFAPYCRLRLPVLTFHIHQALQDRNLGAWAQLMQEGLRHFSCDMHPGL